MNRLSRLPFNLFHGVFFILMFLSIILYKERLFADAAYYFFHTVNKGWFHIEADRITIALSQLLPLMGYLIGLPLKFLMLLSSIGHELFFYGVFLLLAYGLKDKAAAVCLLLIHLIGQLWLFYIPFLEISYGAALAILFYSILMSNKWKDDKWLIFLLVLEWFIIFSHPENLFIIPFLLVVDVINRGLLKKIHLSVIAFFCIGMVIKVLNFSSYDQQKLGNSIKDSTEVIDFNEYATNVFHVFVEYYWELFLLLFITFIFLMIRKQWKMIVILLLTLSGLLFIINKIESTDTFYWYSEVVNSPLVFVVVFFFAFGVWKELKGNVKTLLSIGLFLICISRIVWIWEFGKPLQQRSAQLERLVDQAQFLQPSKFQLRAENFKRSYSNINWANPIESILYSAIDGKENTVSIATEYDLNYQNNQSKLNDSTFLFRRFEIKPLKFLNPSYFELKDERYISLNNNGLAENIQELSEKILIYPFPLKKVIEIPANDTINLMLRVENNTGRQLPSAKQEQLFLSYHWFNESELMEWDGLRTPLEVDIYQEWYQEIELATPKEKGAYFLQIDMVVEGKNWLGLEEKYKITVR